MANLALAYQTGRGVPANQAEARRWRDLAAAHGYRPPAAAPPPPDAPVPTTADLLLVSGAPGTRPSAALCRQLQAAADQCRKQADDGAQCY